MEVPVTGDDDAVVLVVDDEESVAEVFALWLEDDYDVRVATSGEEALDQLDPAVDVVLLDRRMPGLSGDQVLTELRDRGITARVAMVTAVDPDFDILSMEFDDYLTKPVDRDELHDTVERLLGLSDYDERSQEHFALAQKLATIEGELPASELQANDEYVALRDRLENIRDELDDIFSGMDEEASDQLFRDLGKDPEQ